MKWQFAAEEALSVIAKRMGLKGPDYLVLRRWIAAQLKKANRLMVTAADVDRLGNQWEGGRRG